MKERQQGPVLTTGMSDFTQMHIFFAVTTAAVVLVGVLLSLALMYVVRILRNVDKLSQAALDESDLLRADIAQLRSQVQAEGFKLKHLASFLRRRVERFAGMKKEK